MKFKAAVVALSAHVKAGVAAAGIALPVYADPTMQPDVGSSPAGWIELHFDFGDQGPTGGRFGNQTYYNSVGVLTCSIYVPRKLGDGSAWTAADVLADLCREATVDDVTFLHVRPSPAPLEADDTEFHLDVIATFQLEAFV